MNFTKDDTFTAGELADMFKIPKQTLLYYDKMGALKPEYIAENGYRHYNMKQYMTLEIILNLRKMDIPMDIICNYLENRSVDSLEKLLHDKLNECDKIILKNQQIKENIMVTCHQINKIRQTVLNQFTLSFRPAKRFFISSVEASSDGSDHFKIFTEHNLSVFSKQHFKEKAVGWIVPKSEFLNSSQPRYIAFFSSLKKDQPLNTLNSDNIFIRPAGLYATIRFKGTYRNNITFISDRFRNFLTCNKLKPVGDAYVMPLKNHWMTKETEEYINQISIQVEQN